MFEILNIFHKAEFQYHQIYDCDLNNCKKKAKKKTNTQILKTLDLVNFFYCFLCWQGTGIILRLKWVLSRHRNLRFIKFKIFVGNCDLKSRRSQKSSNMQSLFWNIWNLNFQYEKFIFKLHLRREITTKLKILENMIRLSFWKCFFLELVSLNIAFWRL